MKHTHHRRTKLERCCQTCGHGMRLQCDRCKSGNSHPDLSILTDEELDQLEAISDKLAQRTAQRGDNAKAI